MTPRGSGVTKTTTYYGADAAPIIPNRTGFWRRLVRRIFLGEKPHYSLGLPKRLDPDEVLTYEIRDDKNAPWRPMNGN